MTQNEKITFSEAIKSPTMIAALVPLVIAAVTGGFSLFDRYVIKSDQREIKNLESLNAALHQEISTLKIARNFEFVLLMDSSEPQAIYIPANNTGGRTNSDEVSYALLSSTQDGHAVIKELVGSGWRDDRSREVFSLAPKVIIAHQSAFGFPEIQQTSINENKRPNDIKRSDESGEQYQNRMFKRTLIDRMPNSMIDIPIIVYSRSFNLDENKKRFCLEAIGDSHENDKVYLFTVSADGTGFKMGGVNANNIAKLYDKAIENKLPDRDWATRCDKL